VAKPEPEKKRQPAASAERRVLPMQLRTGDRSTRDGGGSRSREGCPLAVAVFRGRAAVFKDNFAAVLVRRLPDRYHVVLLPRSGRTASEVRMTLAAERYRRPSRCAAAGTSIPLRSSWRFAVRGTRVSDCRQSGVAPRWHRSGRIPPGPARPGESRYDRIQLPRIS
jgi:hypothetical protein